MTDWVSEWKQQAEENSDPPWTSMAILKLVSEVERLRGLLGRLEWAGHFCPACGAIEDRDDHEPDCWLAAELRNVPPEGEQP
jgi:hypothetical protein